MENADDSAGSFFASSPVSSEVRLRRYMEKAIAPSGLITYGIRYCIAPRGFME